MKTISLIIVLWMFWAIASAEVSIETIGAQQPGPLMSVSQDYRFQVQSDSEKYFFGAYETLGLCPEYCGVTFQLLGGGFGKTLQFEKFSLYGQLGIYYIKPTQYESKVNEVWYYYFTKRFGKFTAGVTQYRIDNGNGFGGQIGVKIPFTRNSGVKFYYRTLQFWLNPVAQLEGGSYWHDPQTVHFDGFGVGYWVRF